jgi:hypothetical protein
MNTRRRPKRRLTPAALRRMREQHPAAHTSLYRRMQERSIVPVVTAAARRSARTGTRRWHDTRFREAFGRSAHPWGAEAVSRAAV